MWEFERKTGFRQGNWLLPTLFHSTLKVFESNTNMRLFRVCRPYILHLDSTKVAHKTGGTFKMGVEKVGTIYGEIIQHNVP